ncbi:MaoC family dehydratase [Nesterenkonia salmonea]|uniref:MaoC family dehydratase n=1 Tax=Nesterenkonia salmonea TaxID=1804987 RepID=A0A5R9B738_9MICC|nr:MaoC family dehydratase [Nesterenkonia salmonea]TLP92710.1 MaoC family dehydratase [Nesterenkonia salmonea]
MSSTDRPGVISAASPGELAESVGHTATGEWFTIDQERIQLFADATLDHQWIHLDAERAASGPFGAAVAHGYLTLSLLPHLAASLIEVGQVSMAMNYGLDKVRFIAPVNAGSRVRATTELNAVEDTALGTRVNSTVTIELEGSSKPALVAETVSIYVPEQ